MVRSKYRGRVGLHAATINYQRNQKFETGDKHQHHISYKRALRNLIILIFSYYTDHCWPHSVHIGHQILCVHECLIVVEQLGHYHQCVCWVADQMEEPVKDRFQVNWKDV